MKQFSALPFFFVVATLSSSLLMTGCNTTDAADAQGNVAKVGSKTQPKSVAPSETVLTTMTESKENAYTVKMPKGWKNRLSLVPINGLKRPLVTTMNPTGNVLLFMGDPQITAFNIPTPEFNPDNLIVKNPMIKFANFTKAEPFFTQYLTEKFGTLPDFKIVGAAPNPALMELMRKSIQKHNMQAEASCVLIAFDYRMNGKLIRSLINGSTMKMGTVWIADISGVSTSGDPTQYNNMLLQMVTSFQTNQQWQANEMALSQQRHEATMAMIEANTQLLTQRHEANMAAIQESAARHQQRMADLHAAGDAQMNAWKAQQAENDISHERFMNYIKGENTVTNSSGTKFQVQAGSDRYYKNNGSNTFVGTDSTKELEDLRKIWGLNPEDYEEVKVQ